MGLATKKGGPLNAALPSASNRRLAVAGLAGGCALLAHFSTLDAAGLSAFTTRLRAGEADLFAELA